MDGRVRSDRLASGLTVAIGAFASSIRPTDEFGMPSHELTGIGLAIAGMFLVARSAHR
jgi:hypothetical protein